MTPATAAVQQRMFAFHPLLDVWQMTIAERCALVALLDALRPACAIEIGTAQGGSLAVLSHFAGQVYSIDPNASCREQLSGRFLNVEFLTGYSQDLLPGLIDTLQSGAQPLEFVLIDGDHRREAVRRDIEMVLRYQPRRPLTIVMHDSFHPECRQGITEAPWAECQYVSGVELDFVPGVLSDNPGFDWQMWGGLAYAQLLPEPRQGGLAVQGTSNRMFQSLLPASAHSRGISRRLHRLVGALQRS